MHCKIEAASRPSSGLMWLTADRLFYVGLLGAPSVRTMGSLTVYVAVAGACIRIRVDGGEWETTDIAVVPPYVPHQVLTEARVINVLKFEAETLDLDALPPELRGRGAVDAPAFVRLVRQRQHEMLQQFGAIDLLTLDFDDCFFGAALEPRRMDRRIAAVLERVKRDPSAPAIAEECAEMAHLSFSRFLHLFKQEVGAPFRSFRTWKRARNLLRYVNRDANLTHIAFDTGYPDSTHFSHSIRQVYGLKPRDIFAGSRRLALFDASPPPIWALGGK